MTADQVLQFLDDFGALVHGVDKKTKLISVRVPENILNTFKVKAKKNGFKYQSIIVKLMREWASKA